MRMFESQTTSKWLTRVVVSNLDARLTFKHTSVVSSVPLAEVYPQTLTKLETNKTQGKINYSIQPSTHRYEQNINKFNSIER